MKKLPVEAKSSGLKQGLVQVFTGEGKGKTSAALGTIMRAVGNGLRVYLVFFLKYDPSLGECNILKQLPGVTFSKFGQKEFVDPKHITPEQIELAGQAFASAKKAVFSGDYDLVVMDELNLALSGNMVPLDDVIRLTKEKPPNVEIIITGRFAPPELIEAADLVTEMVKIKHPFDKGIPARKGIEY
jgi:cob(I)alamin adenosyltransferase